MPRFALERRIGTLPSRTTSESWRYRAEVIRIAFSGSSGVDGLELIASDATLIAFFQTRMVPMPTAALTARACFIGREHSARSRPAFCLVASDRPWDALRAGARTRAGTSPHPPAAQILSINASLR